MSPRLRRAIGLVAVPGIALTTLAALPTAPALAADVDPAPLEAGSAWLVDQVTDGLVHNDQFDFDDYGLSIDVALGLDAAGGQDATVQDITDAIADNIDFYVGYDYFPVPDEGELRHVLAGSIAKALVLAQTAGRDGTAYGGARTWSTELEDQVVDTGPAVGRIQDTFNPDVQFEADFANSFGQLLAVQGLDAAGSPGRRSGHRVPARTSSARRASSGRTSPRSTRPSSPATPTRQPESSTDVTALAVLALQSQADDTDVAGRHRRSDRLAARRAGSQRVVRLRRGHPHAQHQQHRSGRLGARRDRQRHAGGASGRHGCAAARPTRRHRATQR